MGSAKTLRLPVLFYRPGLATVPVMQIALVPDGTGAPHHSIRRPLEVLDQTHPPANASLLRRLLPQYSALGCYTSSYLFPPRDTDQFVDEFPEGLSHLGAVLLGFYALGADATLDGSEFASRLSGWTASTYPDKTGKLKPVTHLREKLAAIFDEREELARLDCPPITHVLLSAEDKPAIARLLGVEPSAVGNEATLTEHNVTGDQDASEPPDAGAQVTVHFASDFGDALRLVFGQDLLCRYRRTLFRQGLFRSKLAWAALLAAVLLVALASAMVLGTHSVATVAIVGKTSIQAFDEAGKSLWKVPVGGEVSIHKLITDRHGGKMVVAGLGWDDVGLGEVVALDEGGKQLWRVPTGNTSPYPGHFKVQMGVRYMLIDDLLPEPGQEIVTVSCCPWYPCRVCIISEDGRLLGDMWHPGVLSGVTRFGSTSLLVFWGCNNAVKQPSKEAPDEGAPYTQAIFCVRARNIGGQCPPHTAPGMPVTDLQWYKTLTPLGRYCTKPPRSTPTSDSEDDRLEVWTDRGWVLHVNPQGNVVSQGHGDEHEQPPTDLVDLPILDHRR